MSEYINRQVEERNRAWETGKALIETAASEKRDLTAEEQNTYDNVVAEMDRRDAVIKQMLADEARSAEIAAAVGSAPEARSETRNPAIVDDAEMIRRLARGEVRSLSFERRADVTKSATGAPVPTSFYDRIFEVARYVGPMLETSTILNTAGGENLQLPRTNAYSTGSVTTEGSTIGESAPTFLAFTTLGAFKESYLVQVSTEMLEDTGVDLLGYLAMNTGQALGYAANAHLTTGTGTVQPTGIVPSAGSGVTGGTGVSGAPTYANLVDLVYSTDAAYRRMPGFGIMGATSAIAALRKMTDTVGQPLWTPSVIAGQPATVLGYRVFENPHMAATAVAAKSLIAGDLSSFVVRQAGGIRFDRSDEYAFADGLVTFRATWRIDSALPQSGAVKYYAGGTA